jgi:hypothetical protein
MAIKTDTCGWVYLSPIDARGVTLLHSSGDLRTTQALNASRSFSVQWSDPIPAHKTRFGIFLLDTKIPCAVQAGSPVQFKLELTDSTGKSFPLLSPDMAILKNLQPGTSIGTGNLATLELIGRTVDVSKAYRRYHSDPMPDAIGNEVERGTAVITPQGKTGMIALDDGAYSLAR